MASALFDFVMVVALQEQKNGIFKTLKLLIKDQICLRICSLIISRAPPLLIINIEYHPAITYRFPPSATPDNQDKTTSAIKQFCWPELTAKNNKKVKDILK